MTIDLNIQIACVRREIAMRKNVYARWVSRGSMTQGMAVDFEYGRFRFPYGDAESRAMTESLFDEARMYPQGETDDLLMALWFIKWNLMRLAPQYSCKTSRSTWHVPPRLTKTKTWPWLTRKGLGPDGKPN